MFIGYLYFIFCEMQDFKIFTVKKNCFGYKEVEP